jgi:prepilin-type N-terminal cleavage/methylation domain-containing protein
MSLRNRSALTLIETLVVLAILAILLALLLSAIQKVRLLSMRAHASNSIRQMLLASHHFGISHQNLLPCVDGNSETNLAPVSVVRALCPYLEADMDHPPEFIRFRSDPSSRLTIPQPPPPLPPPGGGPMYPEPVRQLSVTSLAFNPLVYAKGKQLASSFSDGTATTIAITEHYAFCDQAQFDWTQVRNECFEFPSMKRIPCSSSSIRRSTFADAEAFQDVAPVTIQRDNSPVTFGSVALTFQVRPPLNQCDPRIPQSSFPGGILCGFADGSVRFVSQTVSESAFWGSVTPDRGETVAVD